MPSGLDKEKQQGSKILASCHNHWNPVAAAKHIATMIEDMICLDRKVEVKHHRVKVAWKRPNQGWKKVNTDASFVMASHLGSSGVVIRDEDGRILMASAIRYEHVADVLTAEALAARDGMLLARAGGFDKIVLELDNVELVNLLRSEEGGRSPIAGLWHEIRELSRVCNLLKVSYASREGNEAAHICAKLTSLSTPVCFWSEAFPSDLVKMAEADCNPAYLQPGLYPVIVSSYNVAY